MIKCLITVPIKPISVCVYKNTQINYKVLGGDPAAGSPTATLLRLHPP